MVTRLGMSRKLGPIAFEEAAEQVFLGRDFGRTHVFSEKTLQEIDAEIKRIVDEQFSRAYAILDENRDKVETVKDALLERESIDAAEFKLLMQGLTLPEPELVVDHSLDGVEAPAAGDGVVVEGDTIADASITDSAQGDSDDPDLGSGDKSHVDRTV
jgi:cell division protease FtsH